MRPALRCAPRLPADRPGRSAQARRGHCRGQRADSRSDRGWRGHAEGGHEQEFNGRSSKSANARPNVSSDRSRRWRQASSSASSRSGTRRDGCQRLFRASIRPSWMKFMGRFIGDLGAALSAALVVIGDRLGLYRAIADGEPITAEELAQRTGTDARYVREWLCNQAAGGYVAYNPGECTFSLTPEQAFALAQENSPAFVPGAFQLATAGRNGCITAARHLSAHPPRATRRSGSRLALKPVRRACARSSPPAASLSSGWLPRRPSISSWRPAPSVAHDFWRRGRTCVSPSAKVGRPQRRSSSRTARGSPCRLCPRLPDPRAPATTWCCRRSLGSGSTPSGPTRTSRPTGRRRA